MSEPMWSKELPPGFNVEECSRAIDLLEAALYHYRRKRAGLMSSERIQNPANAAKIVAGRKAMQADPVRKDKWCKNLSHSIRRYRRGIKNENSAAFPQGAAKSGGHPPAAAGPGTSHTQPTRPRTHFGETRDPDGLA